MKRLGCPRFRLLGLRGVAVQELSAGPERQLFSDPSNLCKDFCEVLRKGLMRKPLGSAEQITSYCSSFDFASEALRGIFGGLLHMKMIGVYRPAACDEETGEPDAGNLRKGPMALLMSLMPANGQALTYLNSILVAARPMKGMISGKLVRYGGYYQAECLELSFQVTAATSSKMKKVCVRTANAHDRKQK